MRVRVAIVFAVLVTASLFALANVAGAAPACWQQVLRDWRARDLQTYPVSCYREALRRMPQDLQIYSTASDDIRRALASRVARSPAVRRVAALAPPAASGPEDRLWPELLVGALGVLAFVVVPAGLALHRLRGTRR